MMLSEMKESGSHEETKRPLESPSPSPKPAKASKSEEQDEGNGVELATSMSGKPGVQRYLVAVEYIGTKFFGSQKQPNCRTVVGALEEAFQKFVGQPVSVSCSSRTDAGVHALSNVCHVDVERISKRMPGEVLPPHEPGVVRRAVNHFLQKNDGEVTVVDVQCVPPDFHARFKAQERTYFYRLLSGPEPLSVFERERAWHVQEELDILAMQKACNILVGCHDFSSFRAAGCQAKSPIKTLYELHISEVTPSPHFPSSTERGQSNASREQLATVESALPSCSLDDSQTVVRKCSASAAQEFGRRKGHRCFVITVRACSFLYHQVRLMVGVLKSVGTGDLSVDDVERILNAKTVTACGAMAPACGLYLGNVKYDLP